MSTHIVPVQTTHGDTTDTSNSPRYFLLGVRSSLNSEGRCPCKKFVCENTNTPPVHSLKQFKIGVMTIRNYFPLLFKSVCRHRKMTDLIKFPVHFLPPNFWKLSLVTALSLSNSHSLLLFFTRSGCQMIILLTHIGKVCGLNPSSQHYSDSLPNLT